MAKRKKSRTNRKSLVLCLEREIKRKLSAHLETLGYPSNLTPSGETFDPEKEAIRRRHKMQREELLFRSAGFIKTNLTGLLGNFASGRDVVPERISPHLELVSAGTREARLFRLASLTWSIPVSDGYGRRMRFLVWDRANGKLMGLMALGDPVFNLKVRDSLIGWSAEDRKERLVNVMDAYVLGALPPYNVLLGGKLIACLVRTREIRDIFRARYGKKIGIISGKTKRARLVMLTTSSALGRSSVYNRLRLGNTKYLESIGYSVGYGHFHVPSSLFEDMRRYLRMRRNSYSDGNRFGDGPNWKFRAIRATLEMMGIDRDILFHGIRREVFVSLLARNAKRILRGEQKRPNYDGLLSVREVSDLAIHRWICPRAMRRSDFKKWKREFLIESLTPDIDFKSVVCAD